MDCESPQGDSTRDRAPKADTKAKEAFDLSKERDGSRRIQKELAESGDNHNVKSIAASMKRQDLVSKAARKFMEVGMGILPCGGRALRMAPQIGLSRAPEIILSARDFDADEAEAYGTINKALEPDKIGPYVDALTQRISKFPAESINACKQMVYESIDKPIDEALKAEAYWLFQATSKTAAVKRSQIADDQGLEHDMDNQRNWEDLVMRIQDIN